MTALHERGLFNIRITIGALFGAVVFVGRTLRKLFWPTREERIRGIVKSADRFRERLLRE